MVRVSLPLLEDEVQIDVERYLEHHEWDEQLPDRVLLDYGVVEVDQLLDGSQSE